MLSLPHNNYTAVSPGTLTRPMCQRECIRGTPTYLDTHASNTHTARHSASAQYKLKKAAR